MNSRIPKMLVCGFDRVAGLTVDGRVLCHGGFDSSDEDGQCSIVRDDTGRKLTKQVFFGGTTSVAMDARGQLRAAGTNDYKQAGPISGWKGPFKDVACEFRHTVGLREDGTVVACGWNEFGQCQVSGWRNITAIAVGLLHTLGLKQDGTVVSCGDNEDHQCDVGGWKDIVAIACSGQHSLGLKRDGTVVGCGKSEYGIVDVADWNNIVKIICGNYHTVGLKADGTVVACGKNEQNAHTVGGKCDVKTWTDVKDIICGDFFTIGLKNDGTVLFAGSNNNGVADVRQWKDIVHIVCNELSVFGLKKDGTVVTCGTDTFYSFAAVKKWKLFSSYETVDEDFEENLKKRMAAKPVKTSAAPAATAASAPAAPKKAKKVTGKKVFLWLLLAAAAACVVFYLTNGFAIKPAPDTATTDAVQEATTPDYPIAIIQAKSSLNMRSGPGTSHDVITTIPTGSTVYVQKTEGNWAYVIYEDYNGWCSTKYLSFVD